MGNSFRNNLQQIHIPTYCFCTTAAAKYMINHKQQQQSTAAKFTQLNHK
jgi:hypothetical protein